jgi:two-component system, cell cycle sensor histidine kinase and response regulator CckA
MVAVCDSPGGSAAPAERARTVLLAEDDAHVRWLAGQALRYEGYTVLEAADGAEAVRLGREHAGPIDLLVTDLAMPAAEGRRVAEVLAAQRPGLRVLYLSGYFREQAEDAGRLPAGAAFLEKPFSADELAGAVRRLLAG